MGRAEAGEQDALLRGSGRHDNNCRKKEDLTNLGSLTKDVFPGTHGDVMKWIPCMSLYSLGVHSIA